MSSSFFFNKKKTIGKFIIQQFRNILLGILLLDVIGRNIRYTLLVLDKEDSSSTIITTNKNNEKLSSSSSSSSSSLSLSFQSSSEQQQHQQQLGSTGTFGFDVVTPADTPLTPEAATTNVLLFESTTNHINLGSMGPTNTNRESYIYYDALFFVALQYTSYGGNGNDSNVDSDDGNGNGNNGDGTTSNTIKQQQQQQQQQRKGFHTPTITSTSTVLEVGCAKDPFINRLTWIPNKFCVAPYQVDYTKDKTNANTNKQTESKTNSTTTTMKSESEASITSNNPSSTHMYYADFATWIPPPPPPPQASSSSSLQFNTTSNQTTYYDLVLCSQVVEHVDHPRQFVQKLLQMSTPPTPSITNSGSDNNFGGIVIISVPYMWKPCGKVCDHKTHYISIEKLFKWSSPYQPIELKIITEINRMSRIIAVYQPYNTNYIKKV